MLKKIGLLALVFMVFTCNALAMVCRDNNYVVKPYATYKFSNLGAAKFIVSDSDGNLYVTHDGNGNGAIVKVALDGTAKILASPFTNLQGVVCESSDSMGEQLFVSDVYAKSVYAIGVNGHSSVLATLPAQPIPIDIDKIGNYDGSLLVGTRYPSGIYKVFANGSNQMLVDLSINSEGWPFDIAIDNNGRFGGLAYTVLYHPPVEEWRGIITVDRNGEVKNFLPKLGGGILEFDTTPKGNFGADLYAGGGVGLHRVAPSGESKPFLVSDSFIRQITFSSDGSMYVIEWFYKDRPVNIFQVLPKPIADAGDDITVYAGADGTALVKLDGSGSFDPDGDELEYFWYEDSNEIATGVDPNVILAVGEHTIGLIVDDGVVSSDPNSVLVTVRPAIEAGRAYVLPRVINTTSRGRYVISLMQLPGGVAVGDVASDSMVLQINGSTVKSVIERSISSGSRNYIFAFFDRSEVVGLVSGKRSCDITIAGKLVSGQHIYGKDTIRVVSSNGNSYGRTRPARRSRRSPRSRR